jgi:glycosyltransferase involved in cell wall biosynthesis
MAMPIRIRGGVPLKLVEALACGRPVVATPELVQGLLLIQGREVLVADHERDIATDVVRLLTNRELAERIATEGRRRFERDLSLEASLRHLRCDSLLGSCESAASH